MSEEEIKEALKLKLSDRISHKLWKVREQSYRELATLLQSTSNEDSGFFEEQQTVLLKIVKDANAAAQLSGLDAVIIFAERAPINIVKKAACEVCKCIPEKVFTGRPSNKQKGHECFLAFVYAEAGEQAVEGLSTGFSHKTPKVISACVDSIREAIDIFGINAVPIKSIAKLLPSLMDHNNADVRNATKAAIVEMYKWLGESIKPITKGFKEVTTKELEATFEEFRGEKPKPKRLTITKEEKNEQQLEVDTMETDQKEEETEDKDTAGDNELDLAPEINLLHQIAQQRYEVEEGSRIDVYAALNCKKWAIKKQALDDISTACEGKKIIHDDFAPLVKELKRILSKEVNVNVTAAAAKCVECLASGLKESFASYAKSLVGELLFRLKEKNKILVDAVMSSLRMLYCKQCIQFVDIKDDIAVAVSNKVPTARALALQWIESCLKSNTYPGASYKNVVKDLAPIFTKASEDSTPEVRDVALSSLAVLSCLVGEQALTTFVEGLDSLRQEKLQNFIAAVPALKGAAGKLKDTKGIKPHKQTSEPHTASTTAATKRSSFQATRNLQNSRPKLVSGTKRNSVGVSTKPSSTTVSKVDSKREEKISPAKAEAQKLKSAREKAKSSSLATNEQQDATQEDEDLKALAREVLPSISFENLYSNDFKVRIACSEELKNMTLELFSRSNDHEKLSQVIFGLMLKTPGLKDTNATVIRNKLEILKIACQCSHSIPPNVIERLGTDAMEKLGDSKFSALANEFLLLAAKKLTPNVLVESCVERFLQRNSKNPKLLVAIIDLLEKFFIEFNIDVIPTNTVISLLPGLLEHSSATVRSTAIKLAAKVQAQLPAGTVHSALTRSGVKSQMLTSLENELSKTSKEVEEPLRTSHSTEKQQASHKSTQAITETSHSHRLHEKTDVSSKIGSKLIGDLSDKNWKVRQDALNTIEKILRESKYSVEPNIHSELITALKNRINDTNRNLAAFAISVLEKLVLSLGNNASNFAKPILSTISTLGVGDNKRNIRDASLSCLERCRMEMGLPVVLKYLPPSLQQDNAQVRKELLQWIIPHLRVASDYRSLDITEADLLPWIDCSVACLQSKAAEIRQLGEQLLEWLVTQLGIGIVKRQMKGKPDSAWLQVKQFLNKFDSNLSESESSHSVSQSSETSRDRSFRRSGVAGPMRNGTNNLLNRHSVVPRSSSREPSISSTPKRPNAMERNKEKSLKRNNSRKDRESRAPKWKPGAAVESVSPVVMEALNSELKEVVSVSLFSKMTGESLHLKEFLEALSELNTVIDEDEVAAIDNEDILIRWIALRISDEGSISSMLKSLEFVSHLCEILARHGFIISDYEATYIIPVLAEKLGSSKQPLRNAAKQTLQSLKKIFPNEKFVPYFIDRLKSKNSRTKCECMEEITVIIEETKMRGFPIDSIAQIVEYISDKDASVAKSAQCLLGKIYTYCPDEFWNHIGNISERQKKILEDTIQDSAAKASEKGNSKSALAVNQTKASPLIARMFSKAGQDASKNVGSQEVENNQVSVASKNATQEKLPEPDIADFTLDTGAHSSSLAATGSSTSRQFGTPSSKGLASFDVDTEMKSSATMETTSTTVEDSSLDSGMAKQQHSTLEASNTSSVEGHSPGAGLSNSYIVQDQRASTRTEAFSSPASSTVPGKHSLDSIKLSSSKYQNKDPTVILNMMCSEVDTVQIEAIKNFCIAIQDPSTETTFLPASSKITQILLEQVKFLFDNSQEKKEMDMKRLKYLLNALMQICLRKTFVSLLEPQICLLLLSQLMTSLLDPQIATWKDGNQIIRALNLLVLKILENSDRTSLFGVLLELLSQDEANLIDPSGTLNPKVKQRISLILKCISKLSKTDYTSVNISLLLGDIHLYLTAHAAQQRTKVTLANSEELDGGLHMIHSIVNDLVKLYGSKIWEYTNLVPLETKPQLGSWIQEALQETTLNSDDVHQDTTNNTEQNVPPSRDSLPKIFEKIGMKEHSKEGLIELYHYRKFYPEVDLNPYFDATSFVFREYIQRGLERIELEERHNFALEGEKPISPSYDSSTQHVDLVGQQNSGCFKKDNQMKQGAAAVSSNYRERLSRIRSSGEENNDSFVRKNSQEISVHSI
eukprot:jgi/Galph1/4374/GphlegSOOS_G3057.1